MTMGEKILRLRKARGWSQEELAEQIGVTRQAISRWESDAAKPDADNIVVLCNLFGVSADYLLGLQIGEQAQPAGKSVGVTTKPDIYRLVVGTGFMALSVVMFFVLAVMSALDPWTYTKNWYTYDGIAGYVLAHDMQWLVVCILLLFFGGMGILLWKFVIGVCNKIIKLRKL